MNGPEIPPPKPTFWPGLSVPFVDFVFAPSEAVLGVASRPWQAAGVHWKSRFGSLLRLKSGSASSRMSLAT